MVSKNDFSPVEWKKLVQAPLLAGFAVSAADPTSFVGALQEAFANANQLAEAKSGASGELVKSIAEENRIKMRGQRDRIMKALNDLPEDEKFRGKDGLQKLVDKFNAEIDALVESKIVELNG